MLRTNKKLKFIYECRDYGYKNPYPLWSRLNCKYRVLYSYDGLWVWVYYKTIIGMRIDYYLRTHQRLQYKIKENKV